MDIPTCDGRQLDELEASTPCIRGHECLRSNLEKLVKVELAAGGKVLFCPNGVAGPCGHCLPFGGYMVCQCPIRNYIAQHLHR